MFQVRKLGAVIIDSIRADFVEEIFYTVGPKRRLLDLGCGVKPFKSVYEEYLEFSVGIDVPYSPHPNNRRDVLFDDKRVPLLDAQFDIVALH